MPDDKKKQWQSIWWQGRTMPVYPMTRKNGGSFCDGMKNNAGLPDGEKKNDETLSYDSFDNDRKMHGTTLLKFKLCFNEYATNLKCSFFSNTLKKQIPIKYILLNILHILLFKALSVVKYSVEKPEVSS